MHQGLISERDPEMRARMAEHGFRVATQGFQYHGQHWDVFRARQLVVGRQPEALVLDDRLREFITGVRVNANWAILVADVSKPLLVIPLPTELFGPDAGDMVLDGYHRITRAIFEARAEVPAHFLTTADELVSERRHAGQACSLRPLARLPRLRERTVILGVTWEVLSARIGGPSLQIGGVVPTGFEPVSPP